MLIPALEIGRIEAGCDEAGRGPIAGPVTAAAVILPPNPEKIDGFDKIADSKKLSLKRRLYLRQTIEQNALAWAVVHIWPPEIDRINILNAAIEAMRRAISRLSIVPEFIAVDGNRFHPYPGIEHATVVKGDAKYLHIAAASILAKTHRDDYMTSIATQYPQYGWDHNMGYPTAEHYEAIAKYGITPHHRRSFKLNRQLTLF